MSALITITGIGAVARILLEPAQDLGAAEVGQIEVEQDDVGGLLADQAQAVAAARRREEAGAAGALEGALDELGAGVVVLDVDDGPRPRERMRSVRLPRRRDVGAGALAASATARPTRIVVPSPGRDSGSSVPPISSVSRFASGRPSPVPSIWERSAPSRSNGREDRADLALVHAGAVVGDHEPGLARARDLAGDADGAAGAVVLDRVRDQVDQHLGQALAVGADADAGRRGLAAEVDPGLSGERLDQGEHLVEDVVGGDRLERDRDPPGLDHRDLEQLVDEPQQVLPALADVFDRLAVAGLELARTRAAA